MDESRADILAGIRELRAKATEQLTGNQFYMISQQLDSLEQSPELTGELAHSVLNILRARLGAVSGEPVSAQAAVAGDPEIPGMPGSPAEPSTPSAPEAPTTPGTPASPPPSPTPDIPSPGTSPAEPSTPPEAQQHAEVEQIITPRANSFGMPQPTVAINLTGTQPFQQDETTDEAETVAASVNEPVQTGLQMAVSAAEKLAKSQLDGNRYYVVAARLAALRNLPQADQIAGAAFEPGTLDEALTLLRQEIEPLAREARDEAERIVSEIGALLKPQSAQPMPEAPAQPAAAANDTPAEPVVAASTPDADENAKAADPQEAENEPAAAAEPAEEAAPPAPSEPATGFDVLAEAAWRRVQEVSEGDVPATVRLNGATPPPSAEIAAGESAAPQEDVAVQVELEPQTAAPAEPVTQDNEAPVAAAEPVAIQAEAVETTQAETVEPEAQQSAEPVPADAASPVVEAEAPVEPEAEEPVVAVIVEPAPQSIDASAPVAVSEPSVEQVPEQPPAPAPLAGQDKGEAFNDGGSERRSSEPCYAADFVEETVSGVSASDHTESAREESAEPPEEDSEDSTSAVEARLSEAGADGSAPPEQGIAETDAEQPVALVQDEPIAAVDHIEGGDVAAQNQSASEGLADEPAKEASTELKEAAEADQQAEATAEAGNQSAQQQPSEPEESTIAAASEASAPPLHAEPPPAEMPSAAIIAAEQKSAEPDKTVEKPARRGFFGRLFGSR